MCACIQTWVQGFAAAQACFLNLSRGPAAVHMLLGVATWRTHATDVALDCTKEHKHAHHIFRLMISR
jgi:hypothetical protein